MGKITTKFDLEDAVYTISGDSPVKRVVRVIKVEGEDEIKYGFEMSPSYGLLTSVYGDRYSWYDEDDVFASKKEARASKNSKKAELENKRAELNKQLEEVEEELEDLE